MSRESPARAADSVFGLQAKDWLALIGAAGAAVISIRAGGGAAAGAGAGAALCNSEWGEGSVSDCLVVGR